MSLSLSLIKKVKCTAIASAYSQEPSSLSAFFVQISSALLGSLHLTLFNYYPLRSCCYILKISQCSLEKCPLFIWNTTHTTCTHVSGQAGAAVLQIHHWCHFSRACLLEFSRTDRFRVHALLDKTLNCQQSRCNSFLAIVRGSECHYWAPVVFD